MRDLGFRVAGVEGEEEKLATIITENLREKGMDHDIDTVKT